MKHTFLGFLMLLFGSAGLIIIVMFETITLNNDSEYYTLKEALEAAMLESIDINCFRITDAVSTDLGHTDSSCDGQIKISEQKFVENFTRRFAANITGDVDDYTIDFYDIIELPPKASVVISSSNKKFKIVSDSIDIDNGLSGILEGNWYALSSENNISSTCQVVRRGENVSVSSPGFSIPAGDSSGGSVVSGVVSDTLDAPSDDDCDECEMSDSEIDELANKQEEIFQEEQAKIEAEKKAKEEAEAKAKEEAEKNNNESSDGG